MSDNVKKTRPRWRRVAAWTLAGLAVLLLAALSLLLATDRGLQLIADGIHRYGGRTLQIGSVRGRLLGNFELYGLQYAGGDGTRLRLDRLRVDWAPDELLHGMLHLQSVTLDDLQLDLPAASKKTTSSSSPRLPQALPVNLRVDALQLNGFELKQAGATPFTLKQAAFKGSWVRDTLRIDSLRTALPQTGPLTLQGEAQTGAQALDIKTLQLSGPGSAKLVGTLGYGSASSDLTLSWNQLQWPLTGQVHTVSALNGKARLTGTPSKYRYTLNAEAQSRGRPVSLQLDGQGDARETHIEALKLDAGKSGSAQAQGTVAWSPQLKADLDLTLKQVDPGLFAPGWNGQLSGGAQTRTVLAHGEPVTTFDLHIDKSKLRGYPVQLTAKGSTTLQQATLKTLTLDAAKGRVQAQGQVAWAPRLTADLDLTLQHLNPGVFAPQFPGDINGQVHLKTPKAGGKTPTIRFDAALQDSTLRGKPLSLQAHGSAQPDAAKPVVQVVQLALSLGSTRLDASGRATPPFDLKGKLNSPDLGVFDPELGGTLSLDFQLKGPLADPHLVTQGQGRELRAGQRRLAAVDWHADIDPLKPSRVEVTLKDLDAGLQGKGLIVTAASLEASGKEKYQHLTLHAATARGDIDLQLAGGYDRRKQEWGGQIVSLKLSPAKLPAWTLQNSPGLLLGRKRLSLESTCLAGDSGRICADLQQAVKQPGLKLSWQLQAVRLASFDPLLARGFKLAGQLDGDGRLHWLNGDVDSIQSQMTLKDGVLDMPGAPPLKLQPSTLSVQQQQQALHAVVDLKADQGQIKADVTAASAARFDERPLSGQVQVSVPDLAFLQPFVAELVSLRGRLDGALDLGGSIAKPKIDGHIDLADGSAKLRTPGITLQNVTFSLKGQGDGPLALKGAMDSGGGRLQFEGQLDPTQVPLRVDLAVKGKDFQAMDTPDARAWITPDLHLLRDDQGIHLTGSLTVPKADITPRGGIGDDQGVAVSDDQVIVGQQQKQTGEEPLKIYSQTDLVLGKDVHFKGYGLTTRIAGKVSVNESPTHVPLGQGELQLVDGKYKAYGQDLTIKTGKLIFNGGPVTQPGIDILAVRKPREDIEVGVQVRGTLNKPQLSLTSQPAMPREQQLSWLLFGQPLEQNSSANQGVVASAALSLGLSGGGYIANKIGNKLGIDTVSVGSPNGGGSAVAADPYTINGAQTAGSAGTATAANSQAAQLTLGKYLTPRLFVSYGVSLFQPGQTFRLLYTLGHGFKLQTESGVSNGGDLIYSFERGK